jgi:cell wall-associated NlpC family hydrolase
MASLDPRVTPARPDLAAAHLQGKVAAARFVEGVEREVHDESAPMRREPAPDASLDTEALKGERVTVYETNEEGWCWSQLAADGYVGWLPANALASPGPAATHWVCAPRTLAFPGRSIKLPPVAGFSLGCRLAVMRSEDWFAVTPAGYVPMRHLAAIGAVEPDFVAVAERFVGVPYLWGGKTSLGIDCSGLVQLALAAAGIACPRDSDMQERELGAAIAPDSSDLRRGDLIFWKGHVAIARDAATLIHANAHHMAVAIEPIAEAVRRIAAGGSSVTTVKRLQQP